MLGLLGVGDLRSKIGQDGGKSSGRNLGGDGARDKALKVVAKQVREGTGSLGNGSLKGMKILVTGGSGRLGKYVMEELAAAGHWAINVDKNPGESRRWGNYIGVDLSNAGQIYDVMLEVKPDAVVHLAADPRAGYVPRNHQFVSNVGMTHSVMMAAGDLGVRRIVYASSEQANGWSSGNLCPPRFPFGEEDMTRPRSAYALSKLMGEEIAESIVATYPETSAVSLRINFITVPSDSEWISKRAEHWPGGHTNLWAYLDARDAATAFRLAVEAPREVLGHGHRAYMVAAADNLTTFETRDAISRFFGPEIEVSPELDVFGSTVDCARITKDLGWRPVHSWRNALSPQSVE